MSTGKLCCHCVPSFCHFFQAAWHHNSKKNPRKAATALPSNFCGSKGSRSSFALKLWSHHCNTTGMKKREQQHITQCAPQSGASVLQGNFPMTGHTGLKFAKACESYFSSIIVIEGYLKDNRIIVERYLYKRQQKRENQITSNNGSEKKKKTKHLK